MCRLEGFGGVVVMCDQMDQLAVELIQRAEEPVAQRHSASDDHVEDWLHIGWRPADDAQDLGCRSLLLQPFGELAGPVVELLLEFG